MQIINPFAKRALATCGAFFSLGICVAWHLLPHVALIVAGIALLGGVLAFVFLAKRHRYVSVASVALALGCALTLARMAGMPAAGTTREGALTGQVCALPSVGDTRTQLLLTDVRIDGETLPWRVRLYASNDVALTVRYGDAVRVEEAQLRAPYPQRNDGAPDARVNAWARNAAYDTYADALTVTGHKNSIQSAIYALRDRLIGALRALLPSDVFGTVQGMVFGETSAFEEIWMDAYRVAGISHVLSVSGLHVGIVASAVHFALKPLKNRWAALGATTVIVMAYTAMNGFSTPVVRSAAMTLIMLVGGALGEKNDVLNSLGLAALLSLAANPFQLFSASFVMSFTAVIGIALFNQPISEVLRKIPLRGKAWRIVYTSIAVSLGAQFGVLPAQLSIFGTIPTWSVFVNLFAVPLSSAIVVIGFITAILGAIALPIGYIPAFLVSGLVRVMNASVWLSSHIPHSVLTLGALGIGGGLAFVFAGVAMWRFTRGARLRAICAALSVACLVGGIAFDRVAAAQRLDMVFLDVGQGDAAYIQQGQTHVLIDGGNRQDFVAIGFSLDYGERVLLPFLRNRGVTRLDAIIVSHADSDHCGGLYAVLDELKVDRLITGPDDGADESAYQDLLALAEQKGVPHIVIQAGDRLAIGDASAHVLWPADWQGDANESSLVLQIAYAGKRALFTGDIGFPSESLLLDRLEDVDLLKVSHHGSKYASSEPFLSALQPEICVIPVGSNVYGHPTDEVLTRIQTVGGTALTTQDNGAITARFSNTEFALRGKLGLTERTVQEAIQSD